MATKELPLGREGFVWDFGVHDFMPQVLNSLEDARKQHLDDVVRYEDRNFDERRYFTNRGGQISVRFISGGIYILEIGGRRDLFSFMEDPSFRPPFEQPGHRLMYVFYETLRQMFGEPNPRPGPVFDPYRSKRFQIPEHLALWMYEHRGEKELDFLWAYEGCQVLGLPPQHWRNTMEAALEVLSRFGLFEKIVPGPEDYLDSVKYANKLILPGNSDPLGLTFGEDADIIPKLGVSNINAISSRGDVFRTRCRLLYRLYLIHGRRPVFADPFRDVPVDELISR